MSRLEPADKIEAIVGAPRHQTLHLARAVSAEQRIYVMHPHDCNAALADLRECEYSRALDLGIDMNIWRDFEDRVVELAIDPVARDLLPLVTSQTPAHPDRSRDA